MATAFIRTIVLYFLIMVGLRLLGKRQIGELEPIELVLTLLISDLAAVPMQDFGIPLLNGVILWGIIVITGGNLNVLNDTVMSSSLYYKIFNLFNPFL